MRPACRLLLACLTLCLTATGAAASGPDLDWKIVAGERVGPITAETRDGDLPRLFPNAAVKYTFEALTANHLTTIKGDNGLSITIYWTEKGGAIRAVHVHDPQGKWRTESGLKGGMTLRQLEALNEGGFLVGNFHAENEESGATANWQDGRLPATLQAIFTPAGQPTQRLVDGIHFRSSDRGLRRLRLKVTGYIVKFTEKDAD